MKKRKKINKLSLCIYIFMILFFLLVIFILPKYLEDGNNKETIDNDFEDNFTNIKDVYLFTSEKHWGYMPIKFKIKGDGCSEYMEERIRLGFETITKETDNVIQFEEIIDNATYEKDIQKIGMDTKDIKILIKGEPSKTISFGTNYHIYWGELDKNGEMILNYSTKYEIEHFEVMVVYDNTFYTEEYKMFIRNISDGETIILDMNNPDKDLLMEEEKDFSTDILIQCHLETPTAHTDFYNVWTQGDAIYETDLLKENLITYADINFYNINKLGGKYPGGCLAYPDTIIHEILHTFGFEHIDNRLSIMNSYGQGCVIKNIDEEIIIKLKEIYT